MRGEQKAREKLCHSRREGREGDNKWKVAYPVSGPKFGWSEGWEVQRSPPGMSWNACQSEVGPSESSKRRRMGNVRPENDARDHWKPSESEKCNSGAKAGHGNN